MTFSDAIAKAMNDQLILIAFPFFILMLVVEYALDKRRNHGLYEKKDMWTSLSMVPITLVVDILPKALAFVAIVWLHEANWLGLRERGAYAVRSSTSLPLLPGLLAIGLILLALLAAWRREGR